MRAGTMKLSVIMPCFNVAPFLNEALASLVRQTYGNLEILCIDDGSTDATPQILADFAAKDARIRVISKQNTGYGDSVNIGLDRASGEYVCIFEPDDFIEPDMYEVLMRNASEKHLDMSRCTFFDFCGGVDKPNECFGLPKGRLYRPRDPHDRSAFLQPPSVWSALYRKAWLDASGIRFLTTPGASFQDISFAFKPNLAAERCYAEERPLYHYRSHANNSVKSTGKVYAPSNEYAACLSYARAHDLETAKAVFLDMEYASYKWNYLRIGEKDRRGFLRHWAEEWRGLLSEGFRFGCRRHAFYAALLLNAEPLFRLYLDSKARH